MKTFLAFRIDIRVRRTLKEIYDNTTFKSITEIVEKSILEFAKKHGIKPRELCKNMSKFQGNQIYCSKKGNWVDYQVCLKCSEWSD